MVTSDSLAYKLIVGSGALGLRYQTLFGDSADCGLATCGTKNKNTIEAKMPTVLLLDHLPVPADARSIFGHFSVVERYYLPKR